jgi:DNA gyrase subunit A
VIHENQDIVPVSIEEEVTKSYLDYAVSVIVSRALPDVRDGLKPVHRRILYTMGEEGFESSKPHKKSARVVGQVMSKYHPHGDTAIYGALVRMAQSFATRSLLIDGHGNFGSMDGDKAAAMRYTEVRLAALAEHILMDYDKETVDFEDNYDNTLKVPVVLPTRFPNLLINGATGIAVGMATNIPPHNLGEVLDACCALVDQPDLQDLSAYIKGPDLPTGGLILGDKGFLEGYRTGRGSFLMRARAHFEEVRKDRDAIIVTEIPYQVNKADLVQRIAELVNAKELEGISDLRDESDRHGVRIVIELKRDAVGEVVLNRLYTMTSLQTSFGMNMLALHNGRPVQMGIYEMLTAFVNFRYEVVTRRTQYFLRKTRERAHILLGLSAAVQHIDEIIALIKASKDSADALQALLAQPWPLSGVLAHYLKELGQTDTTALDYRLSPEQAKAILALRLQRLTGMEMDKLSADLHACHQEIIQLLELLATPEKMRSLIKQEFTEIKAKFSTPRLTTIAQDTSHLSDEDLIQCEDMVVTVSLKGYIKRVPLSTYRSQRRGGRGRSAMDTRDEDEVAQIFIADTHTVLLVFTSMGQAYQLKVHELPLGSATSRGKPLISLFPLEQGEALATLLPLPRDCKVPYIVFSTSAGDVRKNALADFLDIRANGKIAMKLEGQERLISVCLASDDQDILLSSRRGKSIRFSVGDLRQFTGRTSTGVRGMSLKDGDEIVSMSVIQSLPYSQSQIETYRHKSQQGEGEIDGLPFDQGLTPELMAEMVQNEQFLLSISERGFGKRSSAYAYRCANRGGQGVATMDVTVRTGLIVNALPVQSKDHILLLTDQGQLLRCPVGDVRISGRKTQGVKLFRLQPDERIVSVAIFPSEDLDVTQLNADDQDEQSLGHSGTAEPKLTASKADFASEPEADAAFQPDNDQEDI